MFGWIHESMRQLVTRKYGRETWVKIVKQANFEEGVDPEIGRYYKDEDTMRIIQAMASVIGIPVEEVWEAYGGFLIQFTMETGWDELLRALAPSLEGFLDGLDALHYFIDHVVYKTRLKGPSFRCEARADGALILHYYSCRSGLYPIVKGVVREVARRIYGVEVLMHVQERKSENIDLYVTEFTFYVTTPQIDSDGNVMENPRRSLTTSKHSSAISIEITPPTHFPMTLQDFRVAFPHHICFNKEMVVEHVGIHMQPFFVKGVTKLTEILTMEHPEFPPTFDTIRTFRNNLFIFKVKDHPDHAGMPAAKRIPHDFMLKGAMIYVDHGCHLVFICSPYVTTVRELTERDLFLSDMQRHDSTRDLIMLNQSRMSQVELNRKLEETTKNLKKMALELDIEKQKTEDLLCELMPASVAGVLRQGNTVDAVEFNECTMLFTDIVTFTNICALCSPYDVVNLLNDLYLRFDHLIGLHDVYKVETIGDAYVIVGGVPTACANHAERVLNTGLGMLMECKFVPNPITLQPIRIRVGVHTGSVVAGVVGVKMPRYCLFGDTVNTANRMESHGIPGRLHVSEPSKQSALLTNPAFVFEERGNIDIKGKGTMFTYFLEKNERKSVWEIIGKRRTSDQTTDGYTELHAEVPTEATPERLAELQQLKLNRQGSTAGLSVNGLLPQESNGTQKTETEEQVAKRGRRRFDRSRLCTVM